MIRIWGGSTSLNVQKVLWCCVELGIAFERIDWAGPFGGNDDPAYLKRFMAPPANSDIAQPIEITYVHIGR